MDAAHIVLKPRVSEKSYDHSLSSNTYVFDVNKSVNKQQIADAVAAQFNVKVTGVRTLIAKGKPVRSMVMSRTRRRVDVTRSNFKKAYVTLAEGDSIKIFDEQTEEKK
ncbi:MAG TPA: 50S ribosomal protein L23 [Candidatus Saccharimonadales bacterium]|nr:50S ribosomal protein L23 [Candidatus Saccharimonadales bacterium]